MFFVLLCGFWIVACKLECLLEEWVNGFSLERFLDILLVLNSGINVMLFNLR